MPIRYWLALLSILFIFQPAAAFACTCWYPSIEEYLQATGLAFEGEVIDIHPEDGEAKGGAGWTSESFRGLPSAMVARFKVITHYKGPESAEVDIHYYQSDGANCGYRFEIGQKRMLIARGDAKAGFSTGMCMMIPFTSAQRDKTNRFSEAFKNYRVQLQKLQQQADGDPGNIDRWIQLADFFAEHHEDQDAEAAYTKALTIQPDHSNALKGRADLLFRTKRYEAALANYEAAWHAGHDEAAHKGKVLSLVKLGRVHEIAQPGIDLSELKLDYDDEQRSFKNADMPHAIFRGANLYKTDFSHANLVHADFSEAVLNGSDFAYSRLENSRFHNSKIQGVSFSRAALDRSDFSGSTITDTDFSHSFITSAIFKDSTLRNANMASTVIHDTDMSNANLVGTSFKNAIFSSVTLKNARFGPKKNSGEYASVSDFRGADLSRSILDNSSWSYTLYDCRTRLPSHLNPDTIENFLPVWIDCSAEPPAPRKTLQFDNANTVYSNASRIHFNSIQAPSSDWSHRNFEDIIFRESLFDNSNFSGSDFRDARFEQNSLVNVNFSYARLSHSSLSRNIIHGALFNNTDLSFARIYGMDFRNAQLHNASLAKAQLNAIDIRGTDLSSTDLSGARFSRVCHDEATRWPSGFDAAEAGEAQCPPVFLSSTETLIRAIILIFLVFPMVCIAFIFSVTAIRSAYVKVCATIKLLTPSKSRRHKIARTASLLSGLWLIAPYWPKTLDQSPGNIQLVRLARTLAKIVLCSSILLLAVRQVISI